jgi:hypothetical protein
MTEELRVKKVSKEDIMVWSSGPQSGYVGDPAEIGTKHPFLLICRYPNALRQYNYFRHAGTETICCLRLSDILIPRRYKVIT